MLSRERREEIQEIAERCWEGLEWTHYGLYAYSPELPVSINKILTDYGFQARRLSLKPGIAGAFDRHKIYVDEKDESCLQRKTAAIALGYLLLHRDVDKMVLYRAMDLEDKKYQEAEYFARQLLMPEMYITECLFDMVSRFGPRLRHPLDEIQDVYNVPYSFAKRRLEELS